MSESHFNTTHESGDRLREFEQKAKSQEIEILRLFKREAKKRKVPEFTPSNVHNRIWFNQDKNYPITSVRRALTNLTKLGFLEKTTKKKMGPYGRPEYVWRLIPEAGAEGVQGDLF